MYSGTIRDWPKSVTFGRGSIGELPRILAGLGVKRAFVICGKSASSGPMLPKIKTALGAHLAGVYGTMGAHTPYDQVKAASESLKAAGADAIVSLGGGSVIDGGKAVQLLAATGGDFQPYAIEWATKGMARAAMPDSGLKHIAVPTTAGSASDVMPTAAFRDPKAGKKYLFWDDRIVPEATILDPEMAIYAGPELTAATGMTAVARCIETIYSKHRHPISQGLALHAMRLLRRALPRSVEAPNDLAARADCQMACLMSGTASINAMVSVVHAIGHVVGGKYGLQHGISHSILLAPALRRVLPAIGADQAYMLDALGCAPEAKSPEAPAAAIAALLKRLPLPQRLREVGVKEDEIPALAAATLGDYMIVNLPAPLDRNAIETMLREAW